MEQRFGGQIIDALENVKDGCKICQKSSTIHRRFKLTVGTRDLKFNCRVQVDTTFIQERPLLQMVDEVTLFCAASFIREQSTKKIWNQIPHT